MELLLHSLSLPLALVQPCRELSPPNIPLRPRRLRPLVCHTQLFAHPTLADLLTETATTNGPAEGAAEPPKEVEAPVTEAEPAAPAEDTAAKDADEDGVAEPETNGATAADKKSSSKRKSSGIPEHKGKKLNKKKSMSKITHLDAQPGDYYLARLKGYPPWPSIIADEDMLPEIMINSRPVTTKKADGTYNESYADGGKKMHERTFPIMFLYTNEL